MTELDRTRHRGLTKKQQTGLRLDPSTVVEPVGRLQYAPRSPLVAYLRVKSIVSVDTSSGTAVLGLDLVYLWDSTDPKGASRAELGGLRSVPATMPLPFDRQVDEPNFNVADSLFYNCEKAVVRNVSSFDDEAVRNVRFDRPSTSARYKDTVLRATISVTGTFRQVFTDVRHFPLDREAVVVRLRYNEDEFRLVSATDKVSNDGSKLAGSSSTALSGHMSGEAGIGGAPAQPADHMSGEAGIGGAPAQPADHMSGEAGVGAGGAQPAPSDAKILADLQRTVRAEQVGEWLGAPNLFRLTEDERDELVHGDVLIEEMRVPEFSMHHVFDERPLRSAIRHARAGLEALDAEVRGELRDAAKEAVTTAEEWLRKERRGWLCWRGRAGLWRGRAASQQRRDELVAELKLLASIEGALMEKVDDVHVAVAEPGSMVPEAPSETLRRAANEVLKWHKSTPRKSSMLRAKRTAAAMDERTANLRNMNGKTKLPHGPLYSLVPHKTNTWRVLPREGELAEFTTHDARRGMFAVPIQRNSKPLVLSFIVPLLLLNVLAYTAFLVESSDLLIDGRLAASMTIVLGLVTFRISFSGSVPLIGGTSVDRSFLAVLAITFAIAIFNTITSRFDDEDTRDELDRWGGIAFAAVNVALPALSLVFPHWIGLWPARTSWRKVSNRAGNTVETNDALDTNERNDRRRELQQLEHLLRLAAKTKVVKEREGKNKGVSKWSEESVAEVLRLFGEAEDTLGRFQGRRVKLPRRRKTAGLPPPAGELEALVPAMDVYRDYLEEEQADSIGGMLITFVKVHQNRANSNDGFLLAQAIGRVAQRIFSSASRASYASRRRAIKVLLDIQYCYRRLEDVGGAGYECAVALANEAHRMCLELERDVQKADAVEVAPMQPADESEVNVEEMTDERLDDDNGNSEEEKVNPDDDTINTEALCLSDELPPKPRVDKEGKPREVLRSRNGVLLEIRVQLATVLGNRWMALARTGDADGALTDLRNALELNVAGLEAGNEDARRGLVSNYESHGRYHMMLDEPLPERAKEFYIEAIKVRLGEGRDYARADRGKLLLKSDTPATMESLLSGLDAVVDAERKESSKRVVIGLGRKAFQPGPKTNEAFSRSFAEARAEESGANKTLRLQNVAVLVKRIADACVKQAELQVNEQEKSAMQEESSIEKPEKTAREKAELWLSRSLVIAWYAPDANDREKKLDAVETKLYKIRQQFGQSMG